MKQAFFLFSLLFGGGMLLSTSALAQSFGNSDLAAPQPQIRYNEIVNKEQAAAMQAPEYKTINEHILVFYEDFKISRTLSGEVSCSMKLSVLPLTQNKITQLSLQLVWPEISAVSNFYDVPAQVKNYKKISLLGEGCYSMSAVPNLVSNRCRMKGKTSEECAALLTWATVK